MAGSLPCYWGCAHQKNRSCYGIMAATIVAAVVCLIASFATCANRTEEEGCAGLPGALFVFFIIFVIASTIPCCFFCFCTTRPDAGGHQVVISTVAAPTVQGQAYLPSGTIDGVPVQPTHPTCEVAVDNTFDDKNAKAVEMV